MEMEITCMKITLVLTIIYADAMATTTAPSTTTLPANMTSPNLPSTVIVKMQPENVENVDNFTLPSFLKNKGNNTEVIAQLRGIAALRCDTNDMPDQLVTWMKRGDEQLLTAGLQVYSAETRYSVAHLRHQKVWELRIRNVIEADEGVYECQITTHPPVSIFFYLRVVEARAVIDGARELHVHEGSKLSLYCQVEHATETPLYVFWFHNETMINFQARRPLSVTKQLFGSRLTITNVTRQDAGVYTCEPYRAVPDNVTLHVVAGENSAAMQRGTKNGKEEGQIFAQTSSSAIQIEKNLIFCLSISFLITSICMREGSKGAIWWLPLFSVLGGGIEFFRHWILKRLIRDTIIVLIVTTMGSLRMMISNRNYVIKGGKIVFMDSCKFTKR